VPNWPLQQTAARHSLRQAVVTGAAAAELHRSAIRDAPKAEGYFMPQIHEERRPTDLPCPTCGYPMIFEALTFNGHTASGPRCERCTALRKFAPRVKSKTSLSRYSYEYCLDGSWYLCDWSELEKHPDGYNKWGGKIIGKWRDSGVAKRRAIWLNLRQIPLLLVAPFRRAK
jgi:hypothetical protein